MQVGRDGNAPWSAYDYERNGVASLFMLFAPLAGWRHGAVRDRRAAVDCARVRRDLADVDFPNAEKITLVQENLNPHESASLCEAFPPTEARRIAAGFDWNSTPKHGSWLNIAECELSVLARQCLGRRILDRASLKIEVHAWTTTRHAEKAKVKRHFATADASNKRSQLYPQNWVDPWTSASSASPLKDFYTKDPRSCGLLSRFLPSA